jgi:YD repeat-containing protein
MGHMTEVTMDELGRPVSMTGTGRPVTEWAYDGRGRVISVKQTANGKSREQTYRYNDGGWVEYFTDALGEETKYSRDVVGRLETLKEPDGATTKWKSNNADSIETYTPPNAKSYGFAYDSKTQVLLSEDAPEIGESSAGDVSFSYSAANQLQRISRADGRTIDFSYYDWGGLKAQKLGSATITVQLR